MNWQARARLALGPYIRQQRDAPYRRMVLDSAVAKCVGEGANPSQDWPDDAVGAVNAGEMRSPTKGFPRWTRPGYRGDAMSLAAIRSLKTMRDSAGWRRVGVHQATMEVAST